VVVAAGTKCVLWNLFWAIRICFRFLDYLIFPFLVEDIHVKLGKFFAVFIFKSAFCLVLDLVNLYSFEIAIDTLSMMAIIVLIDNRFQQRHLLATFFA
jgi:hypothetical protein